jgi:hypothetical protein
VINTILFYSRDAVQMPAMPTDALRGFPSVFYAHDGKLHQITPWPFPSTSFSFQYSLTIPKTASVI